MGRQITQLYEDNNPTIEYRKLLITFKNKDLFFDVFEPEHGFEIELRSNANEPRCRLRAVIHILCADLEVYDERLMEKCDMKLDIDNLRITISVRENEPCDVVKSELFKIIYLIINRYHFN